MTTQVEVRMDVIVDSLSDLLAKRDFEAVIDEIEELRTDQLITLLERLDNKERALAFRLLSKDHALKVFETLSPALQSELISNLQDGEVAAIFGDMEPDDRVALLDELPAAVAPRLLRGLPRRERELTAAVLGYPHGSIGRRMSPEYVSLHTYFTVSEALARVRFRIDDAETVYTLPVVNQERQVVGVVGLKDLLRAEPTERIDELMHDPEVVVATENSEHAARRFAELGYVALPVVDSENRLVGIFTIDDAFRILREEESEDSARQGGAEPLRLPYLATPIASIVRSRIVWLLVLAIGATLTVQVLSFFEGTISQLTTLALFVPLLIGTGGNTGNQAATTLTRALALRDVGHRDVGRVFFNELRVGFTMGLGLGLVALVLVGLIFGWDLGLVIGLSLLVVCTVAAAVGGVMPLVGSKMKADPAVFSNPFITTFVDAAGLVIYFVIATLVLNL